MAVLDMERMPATGGLAEHGVEKLDLLSGHYGVEREGKAPFLDADACREEWMMLKQLVSRNYPAMKMKDLAFPC